MWKQPKVWHSPSQATQQRLKEPVTNRKRGSWFPTFCATQGMPKYLLQGKHLQHYLNFALGVV